MSPTPLTVATETARAAVATPVRLKDALTPRTASVTGIPARPREHPIDRAHQRDRRERRQQRARCQDSEQSREGGVQLARAEREHEAACGEHRQRDIGRAPSRLVRAPLEHGAAQRGGRRDSRGIEGRLGRGEQRCDEAERRALRVDPRRWLGGVDGGVERQVADRSQHEIHEADREGVAEHEPERRCDGGYAKGLPENRPKDFGARHAERTQDAERLRSLEDREGHRAVDEEHADDERQQPERRQVRAERRGQLAEGAVLGLGRDEHGAGRRRFRERACLRLGQLEIDAVDAAERPEQLLRRRDVGHDRRLGCNVGGCPRA